MTKKAKIKKIDGVLLHSTFPVQLGMQRQIYCFAPSSYVRSVPLGFGICSNQIRSPFGHLHAPIGKCTCHLPCAVAKMPI
jgi:hypothetical protein